MAYFHITTKARWAAAKLAGMYRAPSLETEGFIHLSGDRQWPRTANRFYRGQADLVLLVIAPARLRAAVRFEAADGEEFPHLYGPLDLDAVGEVLDLPLGADGAIGAPEALMALESESRSSSAPPGPDSGIDMSAAA